MANRGTSTRTRARARARTVALLALCCGVAVATGCGAPQAGSKPTARVLSGLLVVCQPPDALIYVDDRYMGSVKGLDKRPLKLPEGTRRVELRREGYFAHYGEVKLVRGVRQRLQVVLRKEPF